MDDAAYPDPRESEPLLVYVPSDDNALRADRALIDRLRAAPRETVVEELVIPVRDGRAWKVPAGHVCRITAIEGPQVCDMNIWNIADPRERMWVSRTRQFYGPHIGVGDRIWSNVPFMRPIATMIADTIDYGSDKHGSGCHDLLGTRCDPYVGEVLSEATYDFYCHSNLVRAVLPYGLTEFDVHDVINIFQVTGLRDEDGLYYVKPCPAKKGDYVEFFSEIDTLFALSACPGGDLAVPLWGPEAGAEPTCRPIGIQVFAMPSDVLEGWERPLRSTYTGGHGVRHGFAPPPDHVPLTEAVPIAARRPAW